MPRLVHQVHTQGDDTFDSLNDQVPFLNNPQVGLPTWDSQARSITYHIQWMKSSRPPSTERQVFKSHWKASDVLAAGSRAIYVSRAPESTLHSHHTFLAAIFDMPEIALEDFYFHCYKAVEYGPGYWDHLRDVYDNRSAEVRA